MVQRRVAARVDQHRPGPGGRPSQVPPHPIVLAIAPLAAVVTGDAPRPSLARSRDARLAGPMPGGMYTGDVVEMAALAFTGTPQDRRDWRARRTADFGAPTLPTTRRAPSLWLMAMGLGAAWAADADATDTWADALAAQQKGEWQANAADWLRARAGRLRGHSTSVSAPAQAGLPGLDSFAALARIDAAHQTADAEVRKQAAVALTRLDAGRYTTTLLPQASVPDDPLAPLSDREREVAKLLLEGLSYAQIAKELYVTRSTVNFHLSKVYAKTNTSSRHQLVQMLRPVRA